MYGTAHKIRKSFTHSCTLILYYCSSTHLYKFTTPIKKNLRTTSVVFLHPSTHPLFFICKQNILNISTTTSPTFIIPFVTFPTFMKAGVQTLANKSNVQRVPGWNDYVSNVHQCSTNAMPMKAVTSNPSFGKMFTL